MAEKKNRCWPGYEPVPGKSQHEQGSCRPKAESKATPSEKEFRAKRRKQLDKWDAEHPHTRKSASQHLHSPGAETKAARAKKKTTAKKKTAARKTSARKSTTKKPSTSSRTSRARSAAK